MKTLCIDPGKNGCGVAIFFGDGFLLRADFVELPPLADILDNAAILGQKVCNWVIGTIGAVEMQDIQCLVECPQIYPGPAKTDLNDLFPLVAVGAAIASSFYDRQAVKPRDWKGTVDADVMTSRIISKLTSVELARCEKVRKSKTHNMYDAIGMGLWKFGRLNKKVYPGALGDKSEVVL